jgi:mono/diheme cytochrome c family protein
LSIVVSGQAPAAPSKEAMATARIEKVKDNLYVITGSDASTENDAVLTAGNTAVFITDAGITLVDTKLPGFGPMIGRLMSLDVDTGLPLWEFQTGAGMHATPSVFEYRGKPYVVAFSAGNTLTGTAHGDSVWLFGVQGTLQETTPGDTVRPAAASASTTAVTQADVRRGAEIYLQTCVACHGDDGAGGHGGPSLNRVSDVAVAVRTITEGRREMPPFKLSLTRQQILDVGSYVVQTLDR